VNLKILVTPYHYFKTIDQPQFFVSFYQLLCMTDNQPTSHNDKGQMEEIFVVYHAYWAAVLGEQMPWQGKLELG